MFVVCMCVLVILQVVVGAPSTIPSATLPEPLPSPPGATDVMTPPKDPVRDASKDHTLQGPPKDFKKGTAKDTVKGATIVSAPLRGCGPGKRFVYGRCRVVW